MLENVYRSVNIALVELKCFLKINIDISHVIELASTKPLVSLNFYQGQGLRTLHTYRSILSLLVG